MSPEGSYVAWSWEAEVEELVLEISTNHGEIMGGWPWGYSNPLILWVAMLQSQVNIVHGGQEGDP